MAFYTSVSAASRTDARFAELAIAPMVYSCGWMMAEFTFCGTKQMRGEAGEDAVVITVTCMAGMKMGREIGWAERVAWPLPWPEI